MSGFHRKDLEGEKDILKHLLVLDEECVNQDVSARFIIVGGASLLILLDKVDIPFRKTRDIDIYRLGVSDEDEFQAILNGALREKINTAVERFMIPDGDEISRLSELTPYRHELFENIQPFLPSTEIIVAIKSLSDRQSDLDDVLLSGIMNEVDIKKTIDFINEFKTFQIFSDTPDAHWQHVVDELQKKA